MLVDPVIAGIMDVKSKVLHSICRDIGIDGLLSIVGSSAIYT